MSHAAGTGTYFLQAIYAHTPVRDRSVIIPPGIYIHTHTLIYIILYIILTRAGQTQ